MATSPSISLPSETSNSPSNASLLRHHLPVFAIDELPTELLVKVIKLAALAIQYHDLASITYTDESRYYKKLHVIAQTCRVWAAIVKDSPELWWRVDTQDPPRVWMAAIKRSRNHPIHVRSSRIGEPFDQEFWIAVAPHIRRWESAYISLNENVPLGILGALENTAPALRSLEVRIMDERSPWLEPVRPPRQVYLNLLAEWAPLLEHLSIDQISLKNWASPILRDLEVLQLSGIHHSGPSVPQFLEVLRACPSLHFFTLREVEFSHAAATQIPTVILPRLASIDVEKVGSVVTASIIQAIDAPCCTDLRINTLDDRNIDPRVHAILARWITPAFRRHLLAGGHLAIAFGSARGASFVLTPANPSLAKLSISLYLPALPNRPVILEWGLRVIESSTPTATPLTIHADFDELDLARSTYSLAVLGRLSTVVSLDFVWCSDEGMSVILRELSSQRNLTPDGPPSWLCPNLHTLTFISSGPKELVLSMVKARTEAAKLVDGTSSVAVIRKLEVYGEVLMDRWTFKSIRETLGQDAACLWELDNGDHYDGTNDSEIEWEQPAEVWEDVIVGPEGGQ